MLVPGVQIVIWYIYTLENNHHSKSSYQCYQLLLLLFSCKVMSDSLWPRGLQQFRLPCPLPSPRVCPNSCPLSWWCHPTISCCVAPFSSCPQSFRALGSFPISRVFASGVTRQRYYIIIDYIPHTVHFIQVTHLFCNWKFLPLYFLPFSLIFPPLSSPLAITCLFSLSKFGIILKEFTGYTVLFSYMFLFTT